MKFKSLITIWALAFIFSYQSPLAEGCELRTCQRGYADGCVTAAEAKEIDVFCYTNSCGACAEFGYESECYTKYASCESQEGTCGWVKTAEFEKCVSAAKERFIKENSSGYLIEDISKLRPASGNNSGK